MIQPIESNDPKIDKFIKMFDGLLDNHECSILKHGVGADEYTVISLISKTILKSELVNNDLVLIAGLSEKSVNGTTTVILNAREYIGEKNIHIIFHSTGSVDASKIAFRECQVLEIKHKEYLMRVKLLSFNLEEQENVAILYALLFVNLVVALILFWY
jgi:hypothetical protein